MKSEQTMTWIVGLIVLIGSPGAAFSQGPPPPPAEEQPEVLTRGPVHEAFAEPIDLVTHDGMVAPIEPPPNIQEIPPTERPQGEQFAWVPGYWSWDGDRNNYIWVSACWRAAPPNMYWVPGYWNPVIGMRDDHRGSGWEVQVGGVVDIRIGGSRVKSTEVVGWEWVGGFWTSTGVEEIEYLPAPPAPPDLEPPGPPPSADRTWVPGCWYWHEEQYVRRPGYWLQQQPNWVWKPSHYRWTPRGYVFVAGHWDYSLDHRGVLFAPVYFPPAVRTRVGFTYSPTIAIDVGALRANLFVYPRYSHYYFGDYYDDAYVRVGIYPRFESGRRRTYYDPLYVQDRWRNLRAEPRWEQHQRLEYDRRRNDRDLRPARTYREQQTRLARVPEPQREAQQVARPLTTLVGRPQTQMRFERIAPDARQQITRQATQMHKLREERNRWEAAEEDRSRVTRPPTRVRPPVERPAPQAGPPGRTSIAPPRAVRATRAEKVKIPTPLIVDRPTALRRPEFAPPARPEDERRRGADDRGRGRGSDRGDERGRGRGRDDDRGRDR